MPDGKKISRGLTSLNYNESTGEIISGGTDGYLKFWFFQEK